MPPHKLMDLLLGDGVKVLELVQRTELLHVEAVGRNDVGFALQQVFRLVS